jgi:hypothetical protein
LLLTLRPAAFLRRTVAITLRSRVVENRSLDT